MHSFGYFQFQKEKKMYVTFRRNPVSLEKKNGFTYHLIWYPENDYVRYSFLFLFKSTFDSFNDSNLNDVVRWIQLYAYYGIGKWTVFTCYADLLNMRISNFQMNFHFFSISFSFFFFYKKMKKKKTKCNNKK